MAAVVSERSKALGFVCGKVTQAVVEASQQMPELTLEGIAVGTLAVARICMETVIERSDNPAEEKREILRLLQRMSKEIEEFRPERRGH